MAVVQVYGFETQNIVTEQGATGFAGFGGTAAFSNVQARTGSWSVRCNPTSTNNGFVTIIGANAGWMHFGLYVATLPSVARHIAGGISANFDNLVLNTDGTITARVNTTAIGTSTAALVINRWYWIGWRWGNSGSGAILQINANTEVSGSGGSGTQIIALGPNNSEASAIDLFFDDVIIDGAAFLNPSRVFLCVPISDNAVGAGWTLGTGTAISGNSGSTAVKNTPPLGVADLAAGSDVKQIRNAANNTNAYAANLTTYATAGIVATDTVIAAQATFWTAAPSATSPKSGSITLSNPTIAKTSIGTFYNGTAIAGTFATGWKITPSAMQTSPTVTIANSPVLTVTQDTGSTRVSMVCFMAMYVAWTPGARGKITSKQQAINRASSY